MSLILRKDQTLHEAIRFSRKKYVNAVAHAIKSTKLSDEDKRDVASRIATVFQVDRPNFDTEEFVKSCCGGKDSDPWGFTTED